VPTSAEFIESENKSRDNTVIQLLMTNPPFRAEILGKPKFVKRPEWLFIMATYIAQQEISGRIVWNIDLESAEQFTTQLVPQWTAGSLSEQPPLVAVVQGPGQSVCLYLLGSSGDAHRRTMVRALDFVEGRCLAAIHIMARIGAVSGISEELCSRRYTFVEVNALFVSPHRYSGIWLVDFPSHT